MIMAIQIIGGLLLLVLGGEALVRGSVSVAKTIGVPVIIIGLTIVSLGTSAPEMVISILATSEGHPDIAIGNIIGSNIANILLVLGVTASIASIRTNPDVTKRDGILMMLVSVIFIIFAIDGMVQRYEGAIMLAIMVGYLFNLFRRARQEQDPDIAQEFEEETQFHYPLWQAALYMAGGFAFLIVGADIMVEGASDMARLLGVTEGVIGATIVAIGTSAPELVTCVVAAYRKHPDIAIGNVVGSNLFNLAAVLGVAASIMPIEVAEQFLKVDIWVMFIASTVLIPMMISGKQISRTEGVLSFLAYLVYIGYQYHQVSI